MEPNSREDLSALMDGELGVEPARFLLRRVDGDPELARAWSRWHLIRACLNAGSKQDSLHADPVRLAAVHADDAFAARVLGALQAAPQRQRHWARYIGGGAIAAGVAAAALMLSVPQTTSTDTHVAAVGGHGPSGVAANAIAVATPAKTAPVAAPWLDNRQPTFLASHQAAADAALGGVLQPGYLQMAAYAPDAAPRLVRDPQRPAAPYLILMVPESAASQGAPFASHPH